jgi:hypothetical protein
MVRKSIGLLMAALATIAATPALATFVVTVEVPKATSTTTAFNFVGVETFDSQANGSAGFSTNFGTGGSISGTYTNAVVTGADQYGGAGGTGKYATTGSSGYTIDLATTNAGGIDYFGYWLSALNAGNLVSFYKSGALVATFDAAQLAASISNDPNYRGNPGGAYAGQNYGEAYAYLNFYDQGGTFDRVTISGSGHETDNHTIGNYASYSGTVLSGSVPEPSTWAMMLGGFVVIGGALRGNRRKDAFGRA